MIKNQTDLRCVVLRRHIAGETYKSIAHDLKMGTNAIGNCTFELIFTLGRIYKDEINLHYPESKFPHAYRLSKGESRHPFLRGTDFIASCLTVRDLRDQREMWFKLIDAYQAKYGSIDRTLVATDSFLRLDLNTRAINCFLAYGLETIGAVVEIIGDDSQWRRITNFGPFARDHVAQVLGESGFNVGGSEKLVDVLKKAVLMLSDPNTYSQVEREVVINKLKQRIEYWDK